MLRNVKELYQYSLAAKDGEIGRCKDFLFDDERWTIRYMVADTGKWLPGKKVLVSPISLGKPDWEAKLFPVRLTREQIEKAPGLDEDVPVSRQHEMRWNSYFGWPSYWRGPGLWGPADSASELFIPKQATSTTEKAYDSADEHLRSAKEVTGYHIQATDDEIGHVDDFLLDDATWTIRYLLLDTRNWLPGRKVLVASAWINRVHWEERKVYVALTREQVKTSPEYDPAEPLEGVYEAGLSKHYGLPIHRGIGPL